MGCRGQPTTIGEVLKRPESHGTTTAGRRLKDTQTHTSPNFMKFSGLASRDDRIWSGMVREAYIVARKGQCRNSGGKSRRDARDLKILEEILVPPACVRVVSLCKFHDLS